MKSQILPREFYQSENVVAAARSLLGKFIITRVDGIISEAMIVETEAYKAPEDKACHAYGNRRTARTETMFGEGGIAYVYTCYGIHPMFNVVTGPKNIANAVLIRAVSFEKINEIIIQRRGLYKFTPVLSNGPGKLTIALGIKKEMDGIRLYDPGSPINIEDRNFIINEQQIVTSCRVGMSIHTSTCAHRLWRFYIKDHKWVSRPLFPDYYSIIPDNPYKI